MNHHPLEFAAGRSKWVAGIGIGVAVGHLGGAPARWVTRAYGAALAGERNLAPCALARITELPNLAAGHVAHIGARNSMNPKDWIDLAKERGIRFNPMFELLKNGVYETAQTAIDRVWKGTDAQYISFNFNVMDASAAPGVTSTEPGGLESREMMRIAEMIGKIELESRLGDSVAKLDLPIALWRCTFSDKSRFASDAFRSRSSQRS